MPELEKIKNIILKYIGDEAADIYYFGSRAIGNHRPDSDLDILIMDKKEIQNHLISQIEETLEESNILFKVDITLRSRISDEFYQKIKPTLILLSLSA